jgi:signal transduction histidine kinase/serine/threonine protein kinase/tetratricopeptide (TPR) repeat protein
VKQGELQIGPYRLLHVIGAGGVGVVYQTEDTRKPSLKSRVALKLIAKANPGICPEDIGMWRRELEALASISHPNIVSLLDFGETADDFYLALELADGLILTDWQNERQLTLAKCIQVAEQIAEALRYAHSRNVVHLDIKPQNIIILDVEPIQLKLLDFGLARSILNPQQMEQGVISGTCGYLAPELWLDRGLSVGPQTDLFSLGVVLAELLSGTAGKRSRETTLKGDSRQLQRSLEREEHIPLGLRKVVGRLLETDLQKRYRSAEGLLHDLAACRQLLEEGRTVFDLHVGTRDHRTATGSDIPFVGRSHEIRFMEDLLLETLEGNRRTLFIEGPVGIGKSRLVKEFSQSQVAASSIVLYGKATGTTKNVPYFPLIAAVSDALEQMGDYTIGLDSRQALVRPWLYSILDLVLGRTGDAVLLQPDMEFGKERFQRQAATAILQATIKATPIILILDDLQWADPATLELVERMVTLSNQGRLMIVGIFRPEMVDPIQALPQMLDRVQERTEILTMTPLSSMETVELASTLMDESVLSNREFTSLLTQHTGGVPFDTLALTAALLDEGVLETDGSSGWTLEPEKRDRFFQEGRQRRLVEARIAGLAGAHVELLEWASVIGAGFERAVLVEAADVSDADLEDALSAARRSNIIELSGAGTFRFSHDSFREHLYDRIPSSVKRDRHQRIGDLLEMRCVDDDQRVMLELAEHYSKGTNLRKSLKYALTAADIAIRSHAHRAAARYARSAITMLKGLSNQGEPRPDEQRLARRYLADACGAQGEYDQALEYYLQALDYISNSSQHADLLGRQAAVLVMKGEFRRAVTILEEAIEMLGVKTPRGRLGTFISILWSTVCIFFSPAPGTAKTESLATKDDNRLRLDFFYRLTFSYFFFNVERALALQLMGMRIAARSSNSIELIRLVATHAPLMAGIPMRTRAVRLARETLRLAERLNNAGALASAFFYNGLCHFFMGQWDISTGYLRNVLSLFDRHGDVFTLSMAHENLGFIALNRGDFNSADSHLERALELALEVGDFRGQAVCCLTLARSFVARGNIEEADLQLIRAEQVLDRVDDHAVESAVKRTRAVIYYVQDDTEMAYEVLNESLVLVDEHKLMMEYVVPVHSIAVEIFIGNEERFKELTKRQQSRLLKRSAKQVRNAIWAAKRFPVMLGAALRAKALLALRRGRSRQARRLFARAVKVCQESGMRYELALTYMAWSTSMTASDPARTGALGLARGLFDELEVVPRWACGMRQDSYGSDDDGVRVSTPDAVEESYEFVKLKSLIEVGKSLSSTLDVEQLLARIMDSTMEVSSAERGVLMQVENGSLNVVVKRPADAESAEMNTNDFASRSVVDMVLRTGEPVLVTDAVLDPRLASSQSIYSHKVHSVLAFPLMVKGQPQGVIYLENNRAGNLFRQQHMDLVRILAAQASIAMANSLAYQEIERINSQLEERIEERTLQLASAGRDLEEKNRELSRYVRELKDTRDQMVEQARLASLGEMAAGATHEINNPLNFMRAGAYAIRRKCTRLNDAINADLETDTDIKSYLQSLDELSDILVNGCDRIKGIVDGLWRMAEKREQDFQPIQLNELVESTLQLVAVSTPGGVQVISRCQEVPPVLGADGPLRQVILNLVTNALEASGETGKVTVSTSLTSGRVELRVQDDGCGIPSADLGRVFEPFYTTKDLNKGKGLGLPICQQILQHHGGSITVESCQATGTVFCVGLPPIAADSGLSMPEKEK